MSLNNKKKKHETTLQTKIPEHIYTERETQHDTSISYRSNYHHNTFILTNINNTQHTYNNLAYNIEVILIALHDISLIYIATILNNNSYAHMHRQESALNKATKYTSETNKYQEYKINTSHTETTTYHTNRHDSLRTTN